MLFNTDIDNELENDDFFKCAGDLGTIIGLEMWENFTMLSNGQKFCSDSQILSSDLIFDALKPVSLPIPQKY